MEAAIIIAVAIALAAAFYAAGDSKRQYTNKQWWKEKPYGTKFARALVFVHGACACNRHSCRQITWP